jgi:hypothetical protein
LGWEGRAAYLRRVLSYDVEACFVEMVRLDEMVVDLSFPRIRCSILAKLGRLGEFDSLQKPDFRGIDS